MTGIVMIQRLLHHYSNEYQSLHGAVRGDTYEICYNGGVRRTSKNKREH